MAKTPASRNSRSDQIRNGVLPPVKPARATDAPQGLERHGGLCVSKGSTTAIKTRKQKKQKKGGSQTHPLEDLAPAVPALDGVLDDGVAGEVLVEAGEGVEGEAQADKVERLVEEDAVGHDDGAVVLGLLDGVVAAPAVVVLAGLQHGELEVQVGVEGEEDREGREDDVADEGRDYVCEGRGDAVGGGGGWLLGQSSVIGGGGGGDEVVVVVVVIA